MSAIDAGVLESAVERARTYVLSQQAANGSFPGTADVGPSYTAIPIIALHYAGIALPDEELTALVAHLKATQLEDGSFPGYPFSRVGDVCATAVVWSALRCAGLPAHDAAVARAFSFIAENGGLDRVADAFLAETNFAALFVMMAGYLRSSKVPLPPPAVLLSAPVQRWLTGRYDYLNVVVSLVIFGAIVEERRQQSRSLPPAPVRLGIRGLGDLAARVASAVTTVGSALARRDDVTLAFLERYQNPNGALDDTSLQTAMLVAAYHALGVPRDDPRVVAAVTWLRQMIVHEPGGTAWISCFNGDIWGTGFAIPTLLALGLPHDDPAIDRATRFLLDAQVKDESRVLSPMKPGAPKVGGWPFEHTNVTIPDCDDTGIALLALGSLKRARTATAPTIERAFEERTAIQRAVAWLEGMQMPDGGWSAFEYAERKKPRGPLLTAPVGIAIDDLFASIQHAINPPESLGSPAWEDVTARVLLALGMVGHDLDHPIVWRAREFLRAQQLDSGAWWGRWMVNYIPTTGFVIQALAALGDPLNEPWIRRGIDFLREHQNFDGGWGETPETYTKPSLAGSGASVAPLTGIVVNALVRAGFADTLMVARGVRYLLEQQNADGSFPNGHYLHAFFPPQSFYRLSLTALLHPAEAIGAYHAAMSKLRATPALITQGA